MKKLLTATLALLVLAAFPGLSAAQKKTGEKPKAGKAGPPNPAPDSLDLSDAPPKSWRDPQLLNACRVIARPWLSGNNTNKYPNYEVFFVLLSGTGNPPAPGKTDQNGVLQRVVNSGQKIRAVLGTGPNVPPPAVVSSDFDCRKNLPEK